MADDPAQIKSMGEPFNVRHCPTWSPGTNKSVIGLVNSSSYDEERESSGAATGGTGITESVGGMWFEMVFSETRIL